MRGLILFLNRYSNWRTLLGLIFLYLLFPLVIFRNAGEKINELAGTEIPPIDLTFGFSPEKTLQMVEDYGDAARAYYRQVELTWDILYPMVYALLFAVALTMIYRKLIGGPVNYLNLLPFAAMFFDYLENLTIVLMLTHYPEQSIGMATFCELFKLIKWLLLALTLFLIFFGLIRVLLIRKPPDLKSV